MQHDHFKRTLKKINRIYDTLSESDEKLSKIEQDLLLQYIRDLYEAAQADVDEVTFKLKPSMEKQVEKSVTPNTEVETPTRLDQEPSEKMAQFESNKEEPAQTRVPDTMTATTDTKSEKTAQVEQASEENGHSADFDANLLFEVKSGAELSDLLSQSKIDDIGKHLGINDRILIVNELFKGDNTAFNHAVQKLNACSTVEEAKDILGHTLAPENDWLDEARIEKAQSFTQLVLRKFK